jgi:hypothetical protein
MSAQLVPVAMKTEPEQLTLERRPAFSSGNPTAVGGRTAPVRARAIASDFAAHIRGFFAESRLGNALSVKVLLIGARIGGAAAGFAVQLLLARLLTPDGLGLFFSATSLAAIAALFAARGYPSIAARFITRYEQRDQPARLGAFLGQASREALKTAAFAAVLITLGAILYPGLEPATRSALVAAALSVPAMTALALYGAFAGAVRHFLVGLLPELLLRPIIFLLVIAGCMLASTAISPSAAVLILTLITIALAWTQFRLVSRRLRGTAASGENRLSAHWRQEGIPLVLVMLFTSFFADLGILVETLFLDPADLAAFGICLKVSLIVGFVVQIAHQILLPDIAEAYARRNLADVPRPPFAGLVDADSVHRGRDHGRDPLGRSLSGALRRGVHARKVGAGAAGGLPTSARAGRAEHSSPHVGRRPAGKRRNLRRLLSGAPRVERGALADSRHKGRRSCLYASPSDSGSRQPP